MYNLQYKRKKNNVCFFPQVRHEVSWQKADQNERWRDISIKWAYNVITSQYWGKLTNIFVYNMCVCLSYVMFLFDTLTIIINILLIW